MTSSGGPGPRRSPGRAASVPTEAQCLVFSIEGQMYALPVAAKTRIVPTVDIMSLPGWSSPVQGSVSLQGSMVAVIDLRRIFGLPEKRFEISEQRVIVSISSLRCAQLIDMALEIRGFSSPDVTEAPEPAACFSRSFESATAEVASP